jgi:hypothetical protein
MIQSLSTYYYTIKIHPQEDSGALPFCFPICHSNPLILPRPPCPSDSLLSFRLPFVIPTPFCPSDSLLSFRLPFVLPTPLCHSEHREESHPLEQRRETPRPSFAKAMEGQAKLGVIKKERVLNLRHFFIFQNMLIYKWKVISKNASFLIYQL